MNDALVKIYALQQQEINEQERQRQRAIAKKQRLIAAFNASGLIDIFNEFRNVPLRTEIRQRVFKPTVGELTWHSSTPAERLDSLSFVDIQGNSGGPRWWCEETDTGRMQYGYSSGRSGDRGSFFSEPKGIWLDRFLEYVARAADPAAVENKMTNASATAANNQTGTGRRQIQPV